MRDVLIVQQGGRSGGSFLGGLLLLGLVLWLWKWVLLIVGIASVLVLAYFLTKAIVADRAAKQAAEESIKTRADRQLHGYMSGDPQATYGYGDINEQDAGR